MKAPNDCAKCPQLMRLNRDTTKVRRSQANNQIRCAKFNRPAWDAIGECKRSKELT